MPPPRSILKKIWVLKNARRNQKTRLKREKRQKRCKASFCWTKQQPRPPDANLVTHTILIPEHLNLITDYETACSFFVELRKALNDRKLHQVCLDHRNQKSITPEAALLLIAELFRSHKKKPQLEKKCYGPADPTVCWILQEVGYFKYFPELNYRVKPQPRRCLQHLNDNATRGSKVKKLIEHFEQRVTFTPDGRRALYDALIEGMNNVAEHAYPHRHYNRKSYSEWWLVGYFDDSINEISFSFFDQGIGIPQTIRSRLGDSFRKGTALIRDAVEHGRSSTKLDTRGKGLPSLKRFVDASIAGTLVINSHESQCVFQRGQAPVEQTWGIRLPGTLISWNIQIQPVQDNEKK